MTIKSNIVATQSYLFQLVESLQYHKKNNKNHSTLNVFRMFLSPAMYLQSLDILFAQSLHHFFVRSLFYTVILPLKYCLWPLLVAK